MDTILHVGGAGKPCEGWRRRVKGLGRPSWYPPNYSQKTLVTYLTFTLAGVTYTLPPEPCLVAFKVQLHIHPGERLRVWHGGRLVAELPHVDKEQLRDAPLTVEQVMEDILPATQKRTF